MQLPIQITIRDIPSSPALESDIRKKAEKLEKYYDRIISCRVVVEMVQKHQLHGKLYNVRIDLKVPGKKELVTHKEDEDVYIAMRNAFRALNRRLEEHDRKRNGHVKKHEDLMHGHIARLVSREGYGFIEGSDGNEYYFSLTNVSYPKFDQLMIGDEVEYIAVPQNNSLHAHHIKRNSHTTEL